MQNTGILFLYSMTVSLQKQEDFDSFIEREFEITNQQVQFNDKHLLTLLLKLLQSISAVINSLST